MTNAPKQRILIVGPSWVGDMVMAQTLFIELHRLNPHAVIDVLAPAWSRPILERMPEVNAAIDLPIGHGQWQWTLRRQIGLELKGRYDQSIVLPNSLKSALIPWFAGIPVRTGWRGEMRFILLNDIRRLDKQKLPLMVQRFIALAHPKHVALNSDLPRPALQVDPSRARVLREQHGLTDTRPVLVLCPGAEFGPAKRWPDEHFATVARDRIDKGWQVWIMGSAKDRSVADDIVANLSEGQQDHCYVLAGETELADAIDLMSEANAVVSNDSGLMHIAAALNLPLAVIYGSTSPAFTPPLSDRVEVLQLSVDCGPCFKRECPELHLKCLKFLLPSQVISALARLEKAPKKEQVIAVRELEDS